MCKIIGAEGYIYIMWTYLIYPPVIFAVIVLIFLDTDLILPRLPNKSIFIIYVSI